MSGELASFVSSAFNSAVQAIIRSPRTAVADMNIFSDHHQNQVISWNQTEPELVVSSIHEIFAAQAAKTPDALAICAWDHSFSYSQLDQLSTRLAHYLVSLGVQQETMVPLCFEKSAWTAVALFAILKAGGACVQLDPAHPPERHDALLKQSGATVALVSPSQEHLLRDKKGLAVIAVSATHLKSYPRCDDGIRCPTVLPTSPATVLFTSGSTGMPKGIVIEHQSMCSSSKAHGSAWNIGPGTRVLQFAAHTFDVSNGDYFTTLMRGGCVCIPSEHDRINNLAAAIVKLDVNWAFLTPTVAGLIHPSDVPGLKTLVLGGEAATKDNILTWADRLNLVVCYGPAECSIYCSGNDHATVQDSPANLGRPIGASLWVCDVNDHNKPVPIGCVGELVVDGPTVARGYLNNPENTMASFVERPGWVKQFKPTSGRSTVYKTGDLVRYNMDGTLSFAGRKDTQVKIRGQRVELFEVEHHSRLHLPADVGITAEVIKPLYTNGRAVLAAFIHLRSSESSTDAIDDGDFIDMSPATRERLADLVRALRPSLENSLPKYMVPSIFIPLKQVPVTPSGKKHRPRLRKISSTITMEQAKLLSNSGGAVVVPTTPSEKRLRTMWSWVLDIEEDFLGLTDSFFAVGGDSIAAMKLAGASHREGISLSVIDIFQNPILLDMAKLTDDQCQVAAEDLGYEPFSLLTTPDLTTFLRNTVCPQIRRPQSDIVDILPATDFQVAAVVGALMKAGGQLNYFFLDTDAELDTSQLERGLSRWTNAHEILRTVFIRDIDNFYQVVLKDIDTSISLYKTESRLDEFAKALCAQDRSQGVQPGDQFLKFMLVRENSSMRHRLIIRISHALYDGVCLPKLFESLKASCEGQPIREEVKFSLYMNEMLTERTSEAFEHWRRVLGGSSMTNVVTRSQPSYSTPLNKSIEKSIPLVPILLPGITFATVLKAAWSLVLAQFAGSHDVVFGHVIAGRSSTKLDAENIIGPCLNIIPVRAQFQKDWKVLDLLHYLHEQQLDNTPYEAMGCQEAIRKCTDWPQWSRFSSVVQHQNISELGQLEMNGNQFEISGYGPLDDSCDLAILSTPKDGEVEISLTYSSHAIASAFAQDVVDALCATLTSFLSNPHSALPAPAELGQEAPRIAFEPIAAFSPPVLMPESISAAEMSLRESALQRSWKQSLKYEEDSGPIPIQLSFFNLGGDLARIASLSLMLRADGYYIDIETLIDHPTMLEQLSLLRSQPSLSKET